MGKERLQAFSDGVLAIIITIMVLGLQVPHGTGPEALESVFPAFLSYILSFIYIGIYWNNHHHMLHLARRVNGAILWANLHLLFWLSLVPFVTGWMGENHFARLPSALYGVVLLFSAIAYWILQRTILLSMDRKSLLSMAVGRDFKGKISPVIYLAAIASTLLSQWIAGTLYALVALMWLIPDRRIERIIKSQEE